MIRTRNVTIGLIAAATLFGPGDAAGQVGATIRVDRSSLTVLSRPERRSEVLTTATPGTVLEVLDQEGDWYWVLLPRNSNGTRHAGWIHSGALEAPVAGEAQRPTARPAPAEKRQTVDDRRLKKAEEDLEKARREYERLTQPRSVSE